MSKNNNNNKIGFENISVKLVDSTADAYKEKNGLVIDLDLGLSYLMKFNAKTITKAKKFKKLLKKIDNLNKDAKQEEIFRFIEKELFAMFTYEFLDKFYKNKEYEILDKNDLYIYVFGAFIQGHATKIDINRMLKMSIIELTNRIYDELSKMKKD